VVLESMPAPENDVVVNSTSTERLARLRPDSQWRKPNSGKRYVVVGTVINSETSNADVLYRRIDGNQLYTLPVGKFLGDRLVDRTNGVSTYRPRFEPVQGPPPLPPLLPPLRG
jgi:hypothetical protein